MASPNDAAKQETVRASTGTTLDYNGDWSALFDAAGIASGDWNGRLLNWINGQLSSSYTNVPGAMQAYAESQGATNWSSMGAFTIDGGGIPDRSILDRDGAYILTRSGAYILTRA